MIDVIHFRTIHNVMYAEK